jgi:hypothetical protein
MRQGGARKTGYCCSEPYNADDSEVSITPLASKTVSVEAEAAESEDEFLEDDDNISLEDDFLQDEDNVELLVTVLDKDMDRRNLELSPT